MKTLSVTRPWGKFEQFTQNEDTTVKIVTIDPGGALSLQYHKEREEFWYVISGNPIVTVGETVVNAKPGDEFIIPKLALHRMEAVDGAVQVLEVAYGDFDEDNDIVRVEDKYGRAK